jgi:hypothetical protein
MDEITHVGSFRKTLPQKCQPAVLRASKEARAYSGDAAPETALQTRAGDMRYGDIGLILDARQSLVFMPFFALD